MKLYLKLPFIICFGFLISYEAFAEDCPHGKHACEVNRKVKETEQEILKMTDDIQNISIFDDKEGTKKERKTKYGLKALKDLAKTPTYALRGVTWPFGTLTRYLVETGIIEKIVDIVSNDERTLWVYPVFELGFGYGLGGGIGVQHTDLFNKNYKLAFNYKAHLNLDMSSDFSIGKPDAAVINGRDLSYNLFVSWKRFNSDNYYGQGIGALQSDHSIFKIGTLQWGGIVGYEILRRLTFGGGIFFKSILTGSGKDGLPSVDTTFGAGQLPGMRTYLLYFIPTVVLEHNTTDSLYTADMGGLQNITIARHQGLNRDDFDFNEYSAEILQYFRLWAPRHVLALRTKWMFRHETGGKIPFYELSSLDVFSPLHGFSSGRFHDRISAVFNVSYRFPVWNYMDGEFFFDTGRVFRNLSDISFKKYKYDGGIGIQIKTKNYFLARLQTAYGGEGVKVLFKTSQEF